MRDLHQEFDCTAVIRPFTHVDEVIGETVSITISEQYSVLSIGRRRYYFKRENGAFDGTSIDAEEE